MYVKFVSKHQGDGRMPVSFSYVESVVLVEMGGVPFYRVVFGWNSPIDYRLIPADFFQLDSIVAQKVSDIDMEV